MRSFTSIGMIAVLLAGGVNGAVVRAPIPAITPAPDMRLAPALVKKDDPDAYVLTSPSIPHLRQRLTQLRSIELAKILLTAIPESLRAIAVTNLPEVSSILWRDFLDNNKPEWFNDLPSDVQSYLVQQFGPSTAWESPTATDASNAATITEAVSATSGASSGLGVVTSILTVSIGSIGVPIAAPSSTSPSAPAPAPAGLTRAQKLGIGIGVGLPLAMLFTAALVLCFCFCLRRRHKKSVDGSQPPSSPGFIPRFAFQEKDEHHVPLNGTSRSRHVSQDTNYSGYSNWDDDVIETMENSQRANGQGAVHDSGHGAPIPAPPSYHTHSSNRARGKRTSYSSLHSVQEVHEPEESPVLPRDGFRPSPARRTSFGLVPGPAQTKRKPVASTSTNSTPRSSVQSNPERSTLATTAAAATASHGLLRQPMPEHTNSGSTMSSFDSLSPSPGFGNHTSITASPVSALSVTPPKTPKPKNPFSNDYSYVEDYGPEYQNVFPYDDLENGLYGGNTDFSRYPQYPAVPPAKSPSRTEWPLRNLSGHRRDKSPLWDRVYEG
jgi:hypothetical protein